MTILAIGGHSGDAEVMCGALLHKYARYGHRVVTLGLTTGDGGHPTLSRPEYRIQKERETREASEILQVECRQFPYSSGQLAVSPAVQDEIADIIREIRPAAVITHWRESIHRDHIAAHYNTLQALGRAGLAVQPKIFFGDNWEDNRYFWPEYLIEVNQEDVDAWDRACSCFQFFRESFYSFPYRQYYLNLFFNRGAEARRPLANALMSAPSTGKYTDQEIPGLPL